MQYRTESRTCRTGRGRDHGAGVSPTAPQEDAYRGEWDNQKLMAKAKARPEVPVASEGLTDWDIDLTTQELRHPSISE